MPSVLPNRFNKRNDNTVRRTGMRRSGSTFPDGPQTGDIFWKSDTTELYVWDGSGWAEVANSSGGDFTFSGRLDVSDPDNGALRIGSWPGGNTYAFAGGRDRSNSNANHYLVLGGHASDGNTYFGVSSTGGVFTFRDANNGVTFAQIFTSTSTRAVFHAASIGTWQAGHANFGYNGTVNHTGGNPFGYMMRNDGICWIGANTQVNFRIDGTDRAQVDAAVGRFGISTDGGVRIGDDSAHTAWGGLRVDGQTAANDYRFLIGTGGNTHRTLVGSAQAASNRVEMISSATIIATFSAVTNVGLASADNICINVPAVGGTTLERAGSTQIGTTPSSRTLKKNIRGLREDVEADEIARSFGYEVPNPTAGGRPITNPPGVRENNPMFRVTPSRYNFVEWDPVRKTGVANGGEMNECLPSGMPGLIMEEVAEICPDACSWDTGSPAMDWPEDDPAHPGWRDEDGNLVYHRPEIPPHPVSLHPLTLIAYLTEAVQFLKEEVDQLKEKPGR